MRECHRAPDPSETRRKITDGVVAGLVATFVMSGLALLVPVFDRGQDFSTQLMSGLHAHRGAAVFALLIHVGYGSLAGGLFAAGARQITVGRAVLYSLGLWALAICVYAPLVGLGFIAARAPGLAALALPLHVAYGAALGSLVPRGEIVQPIHNAA